MEYVKSPKSWGITFALCVFLGVLGMHRFYVGKSGSGVIWFFTGGLLGMGWMFDLVMIAFGKFTDGQGRYITH